MIVDAIKNAELYYSLSPRIKQAFEWLAECDVEALEVGRHDIDGDNLFVNVMEVDLKQPCDAPLEVHNRYIDIQIMRGEVNEIYGWSERIDCCKAKGEFDTTRDVQFFEDEPQTLFALNERQFAIFLPEDAHAPMQGEGHIRKLIFKVLA